MPDKYTHKNLTEVKDQAPGFGMPDGMEARFAFEAMDASDTGLSYMRLGADQRLPFGHKHDKAEEIYVVLNGAGKMRIDDDIFDIKARDAIRVQPDAVRGFEGGPDGVEIVAFGPRHEGDGELVQDWWSD